MHIDKLEQMISKFVQEKGIEEVVIENGVHALCTIISHLKLEKALNILSSRFLLPIDRMNVLFSI